MGYKLIFILFFAYYISPLLSGKTWPVCNTIGSKIVSVSSYHYVCPQNGTARVYQNNNYPYPYSITCQCDNGCGCQLCGLTVLEALNLVSSQEKINRNWFVVSGSLGVSLMLNLILL
jgi:hypothetical protein